MRPGFLFFWVSWIAATVGARLPVTRQQHRRVVDLAQSGHECLRRRATAGPGVRVPVAEAMLRMTPDLGFRTVLVEPDETKLMARRGRADRPGAPPDRSRHRSRTPAEIAVATLAG